MSKEGEGMIDMPPFKSQAQRKYMFAKHPKIAKKWAKEMKSSGKSMKSMPKKCPLKGCGALE